MAASQATPALIGWRVLALAYDFFPALALWMVAAALFTLGYYLAGHPAEAAAFNAGMTSLSGGQLPAILAKAERRPAA